MEPIEFPPTPVLFELVRDEVTQRREEGFDVGELAEQVAAAKEDRAALWRIYERCEALPRLSDYPFVEPNDLSAIQAARPQDAPDVARPAQLDEKIADGIHGGWLGRCAGVMLGKPFEMLPYIKGGRHVREYLQAAGEYPLSTYAPNVPAALEQIGSEPLNFPACHRDNLKCVISDDDIRYTVMGLDILEQSGADFTTADVAKWWTHRLPFAQVFTAEDAAYRNLMLLRGQYEPHKLSEAELARVATWLNPWREWIGAQIRADGWALACPGDPARAAEFAHRDASLSHVKNGIYGEMYCAAMIAAAAVLDEPEQIVRAGLAQIPDKSRLAAAVRATMEKCRELEFDADRFEEGVDWLEAEFGDYAWVHTINNAAAVTLAVLLGGRDLGQVITIAVMCGWDTDCNGATAGCVTGSMLGAAALPGQWTDPLNDTLYSDIPGYHPIAISECARRHLAVARKIRG